MLPPPMRSPGINLNALCCSCEATGTRGVSSGERALLIA